MPAVVHLIRHGQSQWNAARRVQGQQMDVALTEFGRAQARTVAGRLAPIDEIWTSDLLRARQTAEIIGGELGIEPQRRAELREQGLGQLEGLSFDDALHLAAEFDWTDPDGRVPGGESLRDVYLRLEPLFRTLPIDGRVAVVSHGDTIRVALAVLAGRAVEAVGRVGVANASITTVTYHPPACVESPGSPRGEGAGTR